MAGFLAGGLIVAPSAAAAAGTALVPAGLFGLPSLHAIVKAIAGGFFGALAEALVPGWLKHGTVATIQHLVALPDPASWSHVGHLQGDMTYLAMMLLPVTLAVGAVRYWLIGLTGSAHPAHAVVRCAAVTGVLVIYPWVVAQAVAATNTLTHGILGLPAVAGGLQRIVGVLFGGALLSGAGGVFGAFLVIVGVVFAAGLFAAQVLLTVVLAALVVGGPPLIAVSAIPELSHLARSWADTLLAVALVPLGWTVLFATAGALCLDATSFTGARGELPGHVAAAFAGLITFVIAARLPLIALGEVRHLFNRGGTPPTAGSHQHARAIPGGERVRAAHARLRAVGLEGVPSLGRSIGGAAGALGAPAGGPLGAARRRISAAARHRGAFAGALAGAAVGRGHLAPGRPRGAAARERRGVRERLADARRILANAPRQAITAVDASTRRPRNLDAAAAAARRGTQPTRAPYASVDGVVLAGNGARTSQTHTGGASPRTGPASAAPRRTPTARRPQAGRATPPPLGGSAMAAGSRPGRTSQTGRTGVGAMPAQPHAAETHPGGKLADRARRDTAASPPEPRASRGGPEDHRRPNKPAPSDAPHSATRAPGPERQARGGGAKRRPRPRSGP